MTIPLQPKECRIIQSTFEREMDDDASKTFFTSSHARHRPWKRITSPAASMTAM